LPVDCYTCLCVLHASEQWKNSWIHQDTVSGWTPVDQRSYMEMQIDATWWIWLNGLCVVAMQSYVSYTHTHSFNGPFSGNTQVSRYQKGKTNLDFTEARDSDWQWHQLDHMQVSTSLHADNHASTPPLSFLQAGCPSCHPTNSVLCQLVIC